MGVSKSWPPIFLHEWLRSESRDIISSCALGSPSNVVVTTYHAPSCVLSLSIHTTLCEATEPPLPHLTRRENGLKSYDDLAKVTRLEKEHAEARGQCCLLVACVT